MTDSWAMILAQEATSNVEEATGGGPAAAPAQTGAAPGAAAGGGQPTASGQTGVTPGAGSETGTTKQPGDEKPVPPGRKSSPWDYLPLMLGMLLIVYFFMIRPSKKQRQEQQLLQASLKKGAKVRTAGGILGTVLDVRDDEVVLKIDETTNAKMRVLRGAIAKVYGEEPEQPKS